jgi:hypothetical protein
VVRDIFIACVDGLKGFPDAIEAVFPKTEVQLCVVHMIRGSLRFVSWKDRKAVITDLKGYIRQRPKNLPGKILGSLPESGTASIRPSPSPGRPTGSGSSRSLPIQKRSGELSTRPMPLSRLIAP